MTRSRRYNRGNAQDACGAAQELAAKTGRTYYVVPTAYGLAIDAAPAPIGRQCYKVTAAAVEFQAPKAGC